MELNTNTLISRKFDFTVMPDPEVKVLTIRDHLILSRQNFALITGQPKVGKSTFTSAILASAFAGYPIFDIQLHRHQDKRRIALFDTEQSKVDLYKSIHNVVKMSGYSSYPETLDVFSLRKDDAGVILKLIELYIQETKDCGVVIIDGLLDLVYNFNDERECKVLIDFLKRVTAEYDISIIGILHTGKNTGTSVGHLGSFADRYCQSNLEVIKDNEKHTVDLRGKLLRSSGEFEPISIMRDSNGLPFQVAYWEVATIEKPKKKRAD